MINMSNELVGRHKAGIVLDLKIGDLDCDEVN